MPPLGYTVDFYASWAKAVVEVDGGYHAERATLDAKRQRRLELAGYRGVRVASEFVLREPEVVRERVRWALALRTFRKCTSPLGEAYVVRAPWSGPLVLRSCGTPLPQARWADRGQLAEYFERIILG